MMQFFMELNRVVIAYKRTLHKLPVQRGCICRARPMTSHPKYSEALERLADKLAKYNIRSRFMDRTKLGLAHDADLIIGMGGDGTVLAAAHVARNAPILGVNFTPAFSVGFFCAATMNNFEKVIGEILEDKRKPDLLPLLEAKIEGRKLGTRALNDVLFSSPSPAEMSRYTIHIGGKREAQRSSGVWISAGPGSTAAISSAGGRIMPVTSARLQYLVREPCPMPGVKYKFRHGTLKEGQSISIVSNMSNAFAYIDGPDLMRPIPRGSRLTVRAIPKALKIFL